MYSEVYMYCDMMPKSLNPGVSEELHRCLVKTCFHDKTM
jgi:hypothetical protein